MIARGGGAGLSRSCAHGGGGAQVFAVLVVRLPNLLLVLATDERQVGVLEFRPEELVHCERDGLARSNSHHTRGDTLVESASTLLLEHVLRDECDAGDGGLTRLSRCFLQSGLDGVDGCVGERADGTGDQTDDHGLIRGQFTGGILRLVFLEHSLQFRVSREVGGLVGSLAEGSERDTAVQSAETFLLDDGEQGVGSAAIFRCVEGISQTVRLRLQSNLDDFHGRNDCDGFRDTGGKTSYIEIPRLAPIASKYFV